MSSSGKKTYPSAQGWKTAKASSGLLSFGEMTKNFKIKNKNTKIQFLVICISINEKVESLSANRLITN